MQLLNMYQFDQRIKEPTHITEQSSSSIDLTFTNDAEKNHQVGCSTVLD